MSHHDRKMPKGSIKANGRVYSSSETSVLPRKSYMEGTLAGPLHRYDQFAKREERVIPDSNAYKNYNTFSSPTNASSSELPDTSQSMLFKLRRLFKS